MERFKIIKRKGRKHLLIRWHDGVRWREKSSGKTRRRDAERVGRDLIEANRDRPSDEWVEFKAAYRRGHMADLSKAYRAAFKSACAKLEEITKPRAVSDITASALTDFRAGMRESGYPPSTIISYLKSIRSALNWAHRQGYIAEKVHVELPKDDSDSKAKGRPLAGEEFERMQAASREDLSEEQGQAISRIMQGIWLIGMRLEEAVDFWWENPEKIHVVGLDTRRPMVQYPKMEHKGRRDVLVPLTPDAVEFLRKTPAEKRTGRVWPVPGDRVKTLSSADSIGRIISSLGESAGVVVSRKNGHTKYASAQDLRRSFGDRWAMKVMPVVLQKLMRHKKIETTMEYYVGRSADRTANEVWEAFESSVRAQGGVLGGADEKSDNSSPSQV